VSTEAELPVTIEAAAAALRDGTVTSVALMLARAERHDGWLGSLIARFDDTALDRARQADADLAAGKDLGPLHGMPIAIKNILAAHEGPTTAQSVVLNPEWGAGKDAPVVSRLRAAGAVIVGKTTTMEFAIGLREADKPFPVLVNPWNPEVWSGGSYPGSGSGVAAGFSRVPDYLAGMRAGSRACGSARCASAISRAAKSRSSRRSRLQWRGFRMSARRCGRSRFPTIPRWWR
jgi:aspartyl-tRNA(Asn)/glutamyl-tRNA(Gln) amidotransferase subunit A